MSWFVVLQCLLAAAVVVIVVERIRTLLFAAPLDTAPWLRAMRAALADGDREGARELAVAARPAWVGEIAVHALDRDAAAQAEVDELLTDYRYEAFRRLRALRILASVATASGFFGAVLELIWLFSGDHGLAGLQAGRVERIALEGAALSVAIGIAVSVFAFVSLGVLKRAAVALFTDVQKTTAELSADRA